MNGAMFVVTGLEARRPAARATHDKPPRTALERDAALLECAAGEVVSFHGGEAEIVPVEP